MPYLVIRTVNFSIVVLTLNHFPATEIMAFGDYPPEYDAKHHGPYDPARYYGKRKWNFNDFRKQISKKIWFSIQLIHRSAMLNWVNLRPGYLGVKRILKHWLQWSVEPGGDGIINMCCRNGLALLRWCNCWSDLACSSMWLTMGTQVSDNGTSAHSHFSHLVKLF